MSLELPGRAPDAVCERQRGGCRLGRAQVRAAGAGRGPACPAWQPGFTFSEGGTCFSLSCSDSPILYTQTETTS